MIGDSACIIGLGLMGGSLARDLAALGIHVTGYDADPASTAAAIDAGILETQIHSDLRGALDHDVVVIATPVRQVPRVLKQLSEQRGKAQLITDLGSTKSTIVAAAEEVGLGDRFVGSHPLAGDQRSGWAAGRRNLFREVVVLLCASPSTQADTLDRAHELWQLVGAHTQVLDALEHDARVAWISHLPQAIASALAIALRNHGFSRADLGPGGRDMTRLASSEARIWVDILLTNRHALDQPLRETSALLSGLHEALQSEDEEAILQFLRRGAEF